MRKIFLLHFISLLVIGLGFCKQASATAVPAFVDPIARLDYGQTSGKATLLLRVDGLDATQLLKPDLLGIVKDRGLPTPEHVQPPLQVTELTPAGPTSRTWLLTISADKLAPSTSEPRYVSLLIDGAEKTLAYTLSNASAKSFVWSVKANPSIKVSPGEPLPVSISVGALPATNVRVLQTALVEKSTKGLIAEHGLHLCTSSAPGCGSTDPIKLVANSSQELWLMGVSNVGQYEGSVMIGASEKPEGESVNMTVYSSTWSRKLLGMLTILIGVVLAWFSTVFLKNRLCRNQLLETASSLLATLLRLDTIYSNGSRIVVAPSIARHLDDARAALARDLLELNGLPSKIPSVIVTVTSASVDTYRHYVQPIADWVQALSVLIQQGLVPAWATNTQQGQQGAITLTQTVQKIDNLSMVAVAPTATALIPTLADILTQLTSPPPAAGAVFGQGPVQVTSSTQVESPRQLQLQIARLNLYSWLFVLLVTVLGGCYALIIGPGSIGFGIPMDFLLCLLWGLGLPAGSQLLSATTSSISTTLGVPK